MPLAAEAGKPTVPLLPPAGMRIRRFPGGVEVRVKSTGILHAFLVLFGIFGLVAMAGLATTPEWHRGSPLRAVAWVVCLGLCYAMVAGCANRRSISIAGGRIRCRPAPVPWPGKVALEGTSVTEVRVEVQEFVRYARGGKFAQGKRYVLRLFDLVARCRDGSRVVLAPIMESREEAEYLADMLERRLGLRGKAGASP